MYVIRKFASTSNVFRVQLRSSTTGQGLTGLTFSTSGLIVSTITDNEATTTVYTATASNLETVTTLGTFAAPTASKARFREVDATNHKGLYEIQIANARFAVASAKIIRISITGAAGMLDKDLIIQLEQVPADVTHYGGTAGTFSAGIPETRTASIAANAITTAAIADGAITAAKFATNALDAVWSVSARSLTTFGTLVADVVAGVWAAVTRTITGTVTLASSQPSYAPAKAGDAMTLTSGERSATAAVVDALLLDAGDATDLIASIVSRIGNTNIDEAVLVAAVKAALFEAGSIANKLVVNASGQVVASNMITGFATQASVDAEAVKTAAIKAKTDQLTYTVAGKVDATAVLDSASVTAVQSGLATSAAVTAVANDVTTILGRVTATVATLWGALVEMISGTTPNRRFTAKALELGPSSAGGGSGTGARTVTITINDGASVLQNAIVRMTEGVNTYTATTNASGVAVFNLDDATYTVSISKAGYSYGGTTLGVDGTETATYSMTVVVVTPPVSPALSTGTALVYDHNEVLEVGVPVYFRKYVSGGPGTAGYVEDYAARTLTSNASGVIQGDFKRGWTYEVWRGNGSIKRRFTVPDAGTFAIAEALGEDV